MKKICKLGRRTVLTLLMTVLVLAALTEIYTPLMSTVYAADNNIDFGDAIYNSEKTKFSFPNATISLGSEKPQLLIVTVSAGTVSAPTDVSGATKFADKNSKSITLIWGTAQELTTVQSILQNMTFTYTEGMTVTATVDANETNLISKLGEGVSSTGDIDLNSVTLTQWSDNGHFYLYVPYYTAGSKVITWRQAYDEALSYSLGGRQGYLATLTKDGEQTYLENLADASVWVGGTSLLFFDDSKISGSEIGSKTLKHPDGYVDTATKYQNKQIPWTGENPIIPYYYWACGPETGGKISEAINAGYITLYDPKNGAAPELNAYGGGSTALPRESCAATYIGTAIGLNDIPEQNFISSAAGYVKAAAKGYVVEFGDWSGHDTLTSAKTVTKTYTPSVPKEATASYSTGNFSWYTDEACITEATDESTSGEHTVYLKVKSGYKWSTTPTVVISTTGSSSPTEATVTETSADGVYKVTYTLSESTFITLTPTDPTQESSGEGGGTKDSGESGGSGNGGSNAGGTNGSGSSAGSTAGSSSYSAASSKTNAKSTESTAVADASKTTEVLLSPKTGEMPMHILTAVVLFAVAGMVIFRQVDVQKTVR